MFRALLLGATATVVLCLVFYRPSLSFSQADHCKCDPTTRDPEAHGELISILSELFILLDALVVIEPGMILWPEPNTGCHPPGTIDTTAAIAAGYSPEAVRLMHSLPYLEDWEFEIGHDTHMIAYDWRDEDGFREERVMLYDDDNLMPPAAVQITRGESLYGLYRIYDTQKRVVYPWNYNDFEDDNYFQVPPLAPRKAFQQVIDNFCDLNWLAIGDWRGIQTDWPWNEFPEDWPESDRPSYEADYDVWKAIRGLREIYIDCGWNVDSIEQNDFRRNEFIEKKKRHMEDVVWPLDDMADRIGSEMREKRNAENMLWLSKYGQTVNPMHGIFVLECWPETSLRHW